MVNKLLEINLTTELIRNQNNYYNYHKIHTFFLLFLI